MKVLVTSVDKEPWPAKVLAEGKRNIKQVLEEKKL